MKYFLKALQQVLKYSTDPVKLKSILVERINKDPHDKLAKGLLSDYLGSRERENHPQDLVDFLRNEDGPIWAHQDKHGVVRAGKILTPDMVANHRVKHAMPFLDIPKQEPKIYNGPGGSWMTLTNDRGRQFNVRWSHYDNQPMWETAKKALSPVHAHDMATQLSQVVAKENTHHNTGI